MNPVDIEAGRAIHAGRRALSEAVVERQYALRPDLQARYGVRGREKCREDTEFHLAHLAGALLAGRPSLFADYLGWASGVMSVAKVRLDDMHQNLDCLREVLREALPAPQAEVAERYLESARDRLTAPTAEEPSCLPTRGPLAALAAEYLRLLLGFERDSAGRLILDAVESGIGVREVYLRIFQPTQRELGRLWQAGRITVAQEHYATAVTQLIMSRLAPRLFSTERNGRRAVVTCVAGEEHEVGLRMVADLLELGGWDTVYLGGNLPVRAVVHALAEHRADLLAVSATMTYHLAAVIELIAAVRAEPACGGIQIMAGGRLFDAEPGLWQRVGADGHATSADEACRLADRLVAERTSAAGQATPTFPRPVGEPVPPAPTRSPDDLHGEIGRVNGEVVALNRELARKHAEVGRLNTQLSRQAQDLAAVDRRKSEFLATLAHELRNPLAPVRNAARLLAGVPALADAAGDELAVIERQIAHLARLVDDLMDVARIDQGKVELRREVVDLDRAVHHAILAVRPLVEARQHELEVRLPGGDPLRLEADPTRLEQVLTNLLTNAAKYTDPGGRITLEAERDGEAVVIRVRDSGIGIPPEQLAQVFEMFAQVDSGSNRSQGGLGIGLGLVRSLVEMHGGTITARSAGAGTGSEFAVRLPAMPVASANPAPILRAWPGTRDPVPRRRVLVVDDNIDAATSLAKLLSRLYGQEVQVAHDGRTALTAAAQFRPEVIFLDIGMPDLDGYEVARRLRASTDTATAVVVALTGWGQEADRQESLRAGFDLHLTKPVEFDALHRVLERAQSRAS